MAKSTWTTIEFQRVLHHRTLIGPNGAGKTFFNLITGFRTDRPDARGWQFDGKPVGRPTPTVWPVPAWCARSS
ncbi:MAG: hypothetical protein R2749_04340 [Acidimicrobiales bacterium]